MSTGSRIRRRIDLGRLREAMSGPGADPRTWIALARVDDDADAVRWDEHLGWVADVTFVGGGLDGEGPVPCRVAWSYAGPSAGRSEPVERGVLCVVALPEGDPNAQPVIVGMLSVPEHSAPADVLGGSITETLALGTHLLRSAHDIAEHVDGNAERRAEGDNTLRAAGDAVVDAGGTAHLLGPLVRLADAGATQPFVRGTDQLVALQAAFNAIIAWTASVATQIPALAPAQATLASALTAANAQLAAALSTRINGE